MESGLTNDVRVAAGLLGSVMLPADLLEGEYRAAAQSQTATDVNRSRGQYQSQIVT